MMKRSPTFSVYLERRMARILLLGIISGFPWVLIGSSLSLWLKEDGLSRSTIGWAGLIFGVYALNFLWAPLIDRLRVPYGMILTMAEKPGKANLPGCLGKSTG